MTTTPQSLEQLDTWLAEYIAAQIGSGTRSVPHDKPFDAIGVDSLLAVTITAEIKRRFGVKLKATALYEHNTIAALTRHVQGRALQSA